MYHDLKVGITARNGNRDCTTIIDIANVIDIFTIAI